MIAAISNLRCQRMLLAMGHMLMDDQKPRARWRQLQSQVALGNKTPSPESAKPMLTMVVVEEGISRRVPAVKMGPELARNIML